MGAFGNQGTIRGPFNGVDNFEFGFGSNVPGLLGNQGIDQLPNILAAFVSDFVDPAGRSTWGLASTKPGSFGNQGIFWEVFVVVRTSMSENGLLSTWPGSYGNQGMVQLFNVASS